MPNLMTHKIFGEDVLEIANSEIQNYVKKNPQAFSVGTSGPDYLFYHSQLPWQNQSIGKKVRDIGGIIHAKKINDWYKIAVNSCINEKDENLKATMISFMIGHLTHWGLDSSVHPFIFYRSDGSTKETTYWHYRYESMLDTVMVNKYRKASIRDYPSKSILKTDNEIETAIYKVYKEATEKTYDLTFKMEYVNQSFKDAKTTLSVLYDPSGFKFKIVSLIERMLGKKWEFSSHIVTDKVAKDEDVLNLNNHRWKNPANPEFISNESFLDLYYKAIVMTNSVLNEFSLVLDGKPIDDLLSLIANKSYETGLKEYHEMVEYKSIY
ncbi:MAG: zinc dependent phospholipase C family protein [Erysipelothrix sp.]|nr:zinc dependent phospholipase C family protein [Erysipelothrix sp.]